MIRDRPDRHSFQVQVYAGRDRLTGCNRWASRQVPDNGRAASKRAHQVGAQLLAEVAAGQHRGSKAETVGGLIERWPGWRRRVRPIPPATVAAYWGYIERPVAKETEATVC
jgi:hypothetical protein